MTKIVHWEHPEGGGRTVKIGACRKDKPDPSHTHYEATAWEPDELPAFVDLRPHLTPVEDQGEVGSCTANALAGALEYLEKRTSGAEGRVSRLFIYWNERDVEGAANEDHGAALSDGVKVLRQDGACSEDTWKYDKRLLFKQPHDQAYDEAAGHTIDEAHRVKIDVHDMRHCLAEGYPFVFGLQVYDAFQQDGNHGRIRTPNPDTHEHAGGHAMLCVGYSDKDQVFVVRNSWGPKWGDHGYCYIPYDYLANPEYAHDAWTIRRAHNLDFTQGAGGGELPHGDKDSFFDDNEDHTVSLAGDDSGGDDGDDSADDSGDDSDDGNGDDSGEDTGDDSGNGDDNGDDSADDAESDDSDDSSDVTDRNKTEEELEEEIRKLDAEIAELKGEQGDGPAPKKRHR